MNSWIEIGLDMINSRYANQPSTTGYICQVAKRLQKCRVDFGVDIEINTCPLSIDAIDGRSENVFAIGTINYPVTNDLNDSHQFKGTLIYIKPSIPKNWERLPADILSYRVRHPEFPHERTREQWFSETQFESYRQLGCLIGLRAVQDTHLA